LVPIQLTGEGWP